MNFYSWQPTAILDYFSLSRLCFFKMNKTFHVFCLHLNLEGALYVVGLLISTACPVVCLLLAQSEN